jgi:3-hydroxybutyrate dehydrogenase
MTDVSVEGPSLSSESVLSLSEELFESESVALVTGAASGIGQATAVALAENGCTVLATDQDADGLSETVGIAAEIETPGTVETVPGDLTEESDIQRIVERSTDVGDLRFLANIAGLQHVSPLESFPTERYDQMQSVMLRAPTLLAREVIEPMRTAGQGVIGNMASVHGHYVTSDKVAYNVCKFGLRGLTQSIAAEGEGTVRAFSVSTGYVATPLVTAQIPETAASRDITEQEVIEDVMLGQARATEMLTPVEVANLFVFGFSSHARHLNGGDLLMDGGMSTTYQ